MRLFEFASAEEQLALWKLISTSVWTAIEQQVHQQQQERAAQAKRAATKGKGRRRKAAAPVAVTLPPQTPLQRQTVQQQPTDAAAVAGSQNAANVGARTAPNAAAARAVDDENAAAVADDDVATAADVSQKIPQKRQKTGIWPNKGS
jgi:hypothetical protein